MSDDEYFEFCTANSNLRIERSAAGQIAVTELPGAETSYRIGNLSGELGTWSKRDGRGKSFANTEFILPDHSALCPSASWIQNSRLQKLTREQKRKFIPLCPDFVVELTSPSDSLRQVREKMKLWMANGAQLGWLIDADKKTVYVYRPEQDPQQLMGIETLQGEDPVGGFVLELADIFAEL